ncbi:MAG: DNRLRE domain-containing protein [Actinomycetales bacterium]|nr:DNRLRE domain-containing protein [Actinomycetales bacterium]
MTRSGQTANLAWATATDNRAVTGYAVYRTAAPGDPLTNSAQVGTATGRTFAEPGVPEGTWSYRVVAHDAAGNTGPPSAAVSVTMPRPPVILTLTPTADTYVNSAMRTTNFGTSTTMIADSSPLQIAYLRFDLPSVPAGQELAGAELRLRTTASSAASSGSSHTIVTAGDDWTETGVIWDTRPTLGTTVLGTVPAGTAVNTSSTIPLDVGRFRGLLGRRTTLAVSPDGDDSILLVSREGATSGRPQLVLSFTAG